LEWKESLSPHLPPPNLHFFHPNLAQAVYPSALHEFLVKIGAFFVLKTFLEFVLPPEHYQEQLMLVNEVMAIPEEPRPPIGEMHNHFEAGSGCQVFNEKVVGQFDR